MFCKNIFHCFICRHNAPKVGCNDRYPHFEHLITEKRQVTHCKDREGIVRRIYT